MSTCPTPHAAGVQPHSCPIRHDSKLDPFERDENETKREATDDAVAGASEEEDEPNTHNAAATSMQTDVQPTSLPSSNGRQIQGLLKVDTGAKTPMSSYPTLGSLPLASSPVSGFPTFGPSLRSTLSTSSMASSGSFGSNLASPYLAGLPDITPLPSPIEMPSSGRRLPKMSMSPARSRANSLEIPTRSTSNASLRKSLSQRKKKTYFTLTSAAVDASTADAETAEPPMKPGYEQGSRDQPIARVSQDEGDAGHERERSVSAFVPEPLHNLRPRHVTLGAQDTSSIEDVQDHPMQREAHLSHQRGPAARPSTVASLQAPTPPPSSTSVDGSDETDGEGITLEDGTTTEYLKIQRSNKSKRRKFRQLRELGKGTFSKVMLATRQEGLPSRPTLDMEQTLDPHKLVAVKIIEHGPAGGADTQRIESSLMREVEMLKSVSHPSLVRLIASECQPSRTLLVLTYCPGGDLFELASLHRDVLGPRLVQRMFAELVSAVRYLHRHWIVHRDIKLENVLVNLPMPALRGLADPTTHPAPLVTLTDLGLGRRIPQPPACPLLHTRCGSEDYAAPEILLGQPYDGRQTDAWALGVLLYALLEGRLPFDAPPGRPERSRNTHRIARCDWIWCRFGDADGDWDAARPLAAEYEGARACVEGLLKKIKMGRKSLETVEEMAWVREGVRVDGGLALEDGEDVP